MKNFLILCLSTISFQSFGADECNPVSGNAGWTYWGGNPNNTGTINQISLSTPHTYVNFAGLPWNIATSHFSAVRFCKHNESFELNEINYLITDTILTTAKVTIKKDPDGHGNVYSIINNKHKGAFFLEKKMDTSVAIFNPDLSDDDFPIEGSYSNSGQNSTQLVYNFFLIYKKNIHYKKPCHGTGNRDAKLMRDWLIANAKQGLFVVNNSAATSSSSSPNSPTFTATSSNLGVGTIENIYFRKATDSKIKAKLTITMENPQETEHYTDTPTTGLGLRQVCRYPVKILAETFPDDSNSTITQIGEHILNLGIAK